MDRFRSGVFVGDGVWYTFKIRHYIFHTGSKGALHGFDIIDRLPYVDAKNVTRQLDFANVINVFIMARA